jgi:hypothetical protein
MVKNRDAQLIYLSMTCAIGVIASLASVGLFDGAFRWDFYIQFTNLSNYLCLGVLFAELVSVTKRKGDSCISVCPLLKFIGLLAILLTFFVYNIVLAPTKNVATNFSIYSISLHVLMPILYVVDWVLFYERKATWKYPLYSAVFPLAYITFVLIHAACLNFDSSIINFAGSGPHIYPYFFLNVDKIGVDGALVWVIIIAIAFIALGYVMYGVDKLLLRHRNIAEK